MSGITAHVMESEYYDLYSMLNPYSVLVITRKGKLRKLDCPFRVLCITQLKEVKYNSVCYVTKVIEGEYNSLYYKIGTYYFLHKHFRIYTAF